jgi:1-acyl-sn-glycerol-3-phosphate acyltransferase
VDEPRHGRPRPIDEDFVDAVTKHLGPLRDYLRVEVDGLDRVPDGGAVMIANHTGAAGLDFVILYLTLFEEIDRTFYAAAHPSFFRTPVIRDIASRIGMFEVSVTESTRLLDRGELLLFFPEGEDGNFKPLWKYYDLQTFHPGFARVALAAEAPILPVVVVGGEDSNPSLGKIDWFEEAFGSPLPLPLSLLPLPAKWRVRFLDPIPVEKWMTGDVVDRNVDEDVAGDLQELMQAELDRVLEDRGHPFL